jgi:hypothetical protein
LLNARIFAWLPTPGVALTTNTTKSLAQLGGWVISNVNFAGVSAIGIPPFPPNDMDQSTFEFFEDEISPSRAGPFCRFRR